MGHGLPRSLGRPNSPGSAPAVIKRTIKVPEGTTITMTAASGDGWGTAVIGDFPEGNILLLGAVSYLQFAGSGSDDDLDAAWEGDYGIGTTATTDATLSTTDVNIVPSTQLAAATAEVSPKTRGTQADGAFAGTVLDNTDGSLELNANLLIDDGNIAGDDSEITVSGELHIVFAVLGND